MLLTWQKGCVHININRVRYILYIVWTAFGRWLAGLSWHSASSPSCYQRNSTQPRDAYTTPYHTVHWPRTNCSCWTKECSEVRAKNNGDQMNQKQRVAVANLGDASVFVCALYANRDEQTGFLFFWLFYRQLEISEEISTACRIVSCYRVESLFSFRLIISWESSCIDPSAIQVLKIGRVLR